VFVMPCCFCNCGFFFINLVLIINSPDNSELSFFLCVCVSVMAHFVVGSACKGETTEQWSFLFGPGL